MNLQTQKKLITDTLKKLVNTLFFHTADFLKPTPTPVRWTEAETNQLILMALEGVPFKDIAAHLNRSESACYQKFKKLQRK